MSENFGMLCIKGLRSGDFWVSFANQVGKVSFFSYETNKGPAPLHSFQKYFISKFKICFYVFAKWRWNLLKNYPQVMQFRSRHLLTLFSMGLFGGRSRMGGHSLKSVTHIINDETWHSYTFFGSSLSKL